MYNRIKQNIGNIITVITELKLQVEKGEKEIQTAKENLAEEQRQLKVAQEKLNQNETQMKELQEAVRAGKLSADDAKKQMDELKNQHAACRSERKGSSRSG